LPDLLACRGSTIVLTEGEKDANRVHSLGLLCTTVGRDNMAEDMLKYFAVQDVWIVRDMDAAGAIRAHTRARALHGVANSVRVVENGGGGVELPGLEGTDGKKDLSNWFDLDPGNPAEKLAEVCTDTPLWTPEAPPGPPPPKAGKGWPPRSIIAGLVAVQKRRWNRRSRGAYLTYFTAPVPHSTCLINSLAAGGGPPRPPF